MTLHEALIMAIDDEFRARATYQAVIDQYGPVFPFANIVHAEERHIAALVTVFQRYGLPLPTDRWTGNITLPPTLNEICAAGVAGEIRNYQMYDWLLTQVAEPDARAVFASLRNASANHHLPAFQACVEATSSASATAIADRDGYQTIGNTMISAGLGLLLGAGLIWLMSRPSRRELCETKLQDA
jgi:hypothetical protein